MIQLEEFAQATGFYKTREILNKYSKALNDDQPPQKKIISTPKPTAEPGIFSFL